MAQAITKQFASFQFPGGSADTVAVLKSGPGTLYGTFIGLDKNGDDINGGGDVNAKYFLFDNASVASGTLITCQYGNPVGKIFPIELDFVNGLVIKVEKTGYSAGSVTVVFS